MIWDANQKVYPPLAFIKDVTTLEIDFFNFFILFFAAEIQTFLGQTEKMLQIQLLNSRLSIAITKFRYVFYYLSLGGSSYTDYLFDASHCSIAKLHLYPMWVLRRISQDSGNNTVCCNPFFLILLFNYSYMHSSVNVSSFTGVRHTSLMIKDVKIFLLFHASYIDTIWWDLD